MGCPGGEIPAKLVMQLRAMTGLPMMKCKEALEACDCDLEKAVEWARKKGLETAAKKADRVMKEGRVALRAEGSVTAMVEVDCETEPVAVGADFAALVESVLAATLARGATVCDAKGDVPAAWVLAQPAGKGPDTVDVAAKQLVAKIGENMAVRRAAVYAAGGRVGSYLHHTKKVGVLVELEGAPAALEHAAAATFLAELGMHVAFAKPVGVSRLQVSKETVDRELEIYREQAKQDPKMASKPPPVVEKIVQGKLDKFFAEKCLLEQPWFRDDALKVQGVLDAASKQAGGALVVRRFALFQVGGA